jgi:mucin-19
LVGTDGANVILSQSAVFTSINVANAIPTTITASISGSAAGNYTLIQPSGILANITPKAITITGTTIANKVYDRTDSATVTAGALDGVIAADQSNVSLNSAAAFSSNQVGTAIPVIMNSSISGSAAGNYTLTQPTGITANITTKALTITATNVTSVYGSTTNLGNSAFTQSGLISGDAVNAVTIQHDGSNAIAATVNANTYSDAIIASSASGSGLSNYEITYVPGSLIVTPANLTITPIAKSAVYNGNALNTTTYSASAANYLVSGYLNTDSASNTPLDFTGSLGFTQNSSPATVQNAGAYNFAAGTLAVTTSNSNYTVALNSSLTNQYVITPAVVSLSATKVYDGTPTFSAGDTGTTFTVATGIGSQTLVINGSATANSSNVIGVSSLNTAGLLLGDGTNGGLASNYNLPASTGK